MRCILPVLALTLMLAHVVHADDAPPTCVGGAPDGATQSPEECDDDNGVNGDGCDNNCTTSRCGNWQVVAPETCDDGDTDDADFCPSDCHVEFCEPTGEEIVVRLDTSRADVASLTLFLDYPEGAVSLVGTGTNVPADRVEGPGLATIQPNDFDHATRFVIFDLFDFGTTSVATIHFQGCAGVPAPDASTFACALEGEATNEQLAVVPGVTCAVTVLGATPTTTTTTPTTIPGTPTTTTPSTSTTTTTIPCDSVTCLARNALADPDCAGATVPAPLQKKLGQAGSAAEQATTASGKQQKKLQKKAKASLAAAKRLAKRFGKGKRPKLDPACSAAVQRAVAAAQGALAAGRL